MNNTTPNLTLEQLLKSIEQYFDCALSDEQENALRKEIARTEFSHPAIDEACAVMGIRSPAAICAKKPQGRHATHIRPILSIAASVAIIIALTLTIIRPSNPDVSTCVAYVNGQCVTDENIVLALMTQNATEFHDGADQAQQTLIDDLEVIAPIVDQYESNINPLEI